MAATGSRGTRRLAVIVLAIVAVIGAVAVAVPFLISSEAVRKSISDQITHWTGRTFTFTGDAKLRLFPYLTVRLQNVRLANPGGEGNFITAGQMTGKLELLPLLAGRLEFAAFRIANPKISLEVDAAGRPNWVLDQGVIGTLASKGDSELPLDDPSPATPRANVGLGRFLIRDGLVNYSDARNGMKETFSGVNVDLNWTSTDDPANGKGSFVWRDQPVTFSGDIAAPLTLLAGGDSLLRVAVQAAPANLTFEGNARQFDGMQLEGNASLTVPSMAGLAEWLGAPLGDHIAIGAVSISGAMSWVAANLNFSSVRVDIDGNVGEGALTATVVDGRPSLQGTLDFARFDLNAPAALLRAAFDPSGSWRNSEATLPLVRSADFDLRLSAGQASLAGREIGPVAASLIATNGELIAELGEAHFGTGMIEASVRARRDGDALTGTAEIKADGLAADQVAALFGLGGITGTADVNSNLGGEGATWGEMVDSLTGLTEVVLTNGTMQGFDIAGLPAAVVDGAAAPLGGSTAFNRIATDVNIVPGLIATDDFHAEGADYALDLVGKVALGGPSVEARGVLTLPGEPPRDIPFLVSGPFDAPVFQPDLGAPLPRQPGDEDGDAPVPGDG